MINLVAPLRPVCLRRRPPRGPTLSVSLVQRASSSSSSSLTPFFFSSSLRPHATCFLELNLAAPRNAADNVVDAQKHARRLDGGLETLHLDLVRVPDSHLGHVCDLAGDAVDAQVEVTVPEVFGTQLGDKADGVSAAVLRQRPRDHLQRVGDRGVAVIFVWSGVDGWMGGRERGTNASWMVRGC